MRTRSLSFRLGPILAALTLASTVSLPRAGGAEPPRPQEPGAAVPETAGPFVLRRDGAGGSIVSLRRAGDGAPVEFIRPGSALGPVVLRVRTPGTPWREVRQGDGVLEIRSGRRPDGESLRWDVVVENRGREELEIGDLELPLPMRTDYVWDHEETYVRRVFRHAFIAGQGSFLYWLPVGGVGPILILQPGDATGLEFFTATDMDYAHGGERFSAFVHSKAAAEREARGTWRQPRTGRVVGPGGKASWSLALRWADSLEGVRESIWRNGGADVRIAPGMVVPRDLTAMLALRTRRRIEALAPEFPAATGIEHVGERGADTR